MQGINIIQIIPHPRNNEFFDDITGEKWEEFLESIKTSGVIEPVICTSEMVIVSGHQRIRACKALGIEKVLCEVRVFDSEDDVLKALIETNIRQRGTVGGSQRKLNNIARELERIYGVRQGSAGKRSAGTEGDNIVEGKSLEVTMSPLKSEQGEILVRTLCTPKKQETIAETLHMGHDSYKLLRRLDDVIPGIQDAMDEGNISFSTVVRLIAKLSTEEQQQLLEQLPEAKKLTQKEIQSYIDQLQQSKNIAEGYKQKIALMEQKVKRAEEQGRSDDLLEENQRLEADSRQWYERAQARSREAEQYKARIHELQEQLAEQKPVERVVEVLPDDYEKVKRELREAQSLIKQQKLIMDAQQVQTDDVASDFGVPELITALKKSSDELSIFLFANDDLQQCTAEQKSIIASNVNEIKTYLESILKNVGIK